MRVNKKLLGFVVILLIIIIPNVALGNDDQSTENLLKFVKGDGAFESWFMTIFIKISQGIDDMAFSSSLFGRAIAGFGALISFGYIGWQMQSGDRDWEIMPILKPLFIGLILFNWVSFYKIIQAPFLKLAEPSEAVFTRIEDESNKLRILRFKKQKALIEYLIKQEAEADIAKAQESWVPGSETFAEMMSTISEWRLGMKFSIQKTIGEWMEAIALALLRIMVYFIFFIQKIWSYILIVLGPIAIGFTLVPGFQNSLTQWIAKFININLYTFILYTILDIGQILIMSAYQMEINRLSAFVGDNYEIKVQSINLIRQFLENSGMIYSVLLTIVAYIITGAGALLTPTIADSIVTAGGAMAMSKMKGGTMKQVMVGRKATTTIINKIKGK